ncbi:MAG: Bug family tripartite tricarboxylate transporter substrate binding protein [Clostridia bacterium]
MRKTVAGLFWVALMAGLGPAHGQGGQPVRIIASAPPGTPVDIRARWVAEKLTPALGVPVIVENKPGAGGNIGLQAAARSAPDGKTFVIVHQGTIAINPHLYQHAGYDPIADFAPITDLMESPLVLAVPANSPAHDVAELVRMAKENPGRLSYGSSGVGTPPHMAAALFCRAAGVDIVHVPYKGASASLADLLAGRVAFTIDSLAVHGPHIKSGRLRALAVTSRQRLAELPDVPTLSQSGLAGYDYASWMGVAAPARTPPAVIKQVHDILVQALETPEARAWFAAQGGMVVGDTPEHFAAFIRAEYAKWGEVIREAGIHAE